MSTAPFDTGRQREAGRNMHVAQWATTTLESLRRDRELQAFPDAISNVSSIPTADERYHGYTSMNSEQGDGHSSEVTDTAESDYSDDLEIDLVVAALSSGQKAFDSCEWEEADCLLQEALQLLQQVPPKQRAFCDTFKLQYNLAICAYHTQGPTEAESALLSLTQLSPTCNKQREYVYDAIHLVSNLYIRMDQLERAKTQCEKALQGRRRLLGKQSDAALESTALMAYILTQLDNRPRAKAYLAMLPDARRDDIVQAVESSLGLQIQFSDNSSTLVRSDSETSRSAVHSISSDTPASIRTPPMENRYALISTTTLQPLETSRRQSYQHSLQSRDNIEGLQSITALSLSSANDRNELASGKTKSHDTYVEQYHSGLEVVHSDNLAEDTEKMKAKALARPEILQRLGCQPRDAIEEAVCGGDHPLLASLLSKKKGSWRSKLRKTTRAERVTALHFAALFGDIEMARRLLGAGYNINELPFGYSESLTPLKFAIGARQVKMVEFLIDNGAQPSKPDTWSTLASQLMNRSWLMKTTSEAEKDVPEYIPSQMIAIMRILLQHRLPYRWDINAPFAANGRTVLHQAVTFWTGSYKWDLALRAAVTAFLCDNGADPYLADSEGKTSYELAQASGDQELLSIIRRRSGSKALNNVSPDPVELSDRSPI